MGPFASKNVINEIKIRQGKWISVLGQISETELSKDTSIPQISETETLQETTETIPEEDSTAERPKVSAISLISVFLIAVFGVLLVIVLVLLFRSKAS